MEEKHPVFEIKGLVSKEEFFESIKNLPIVSKYEFKNGKNYKIEYYNVPAAFDIEVSSFMYQGKKCSCMYIWQFGINGKVVSCRTWEELLELIKELNQKLSLGYSRRLPVYIRNMSYEFQFIKDIFKWENIFAREKRVPMRALTNDGIEFRCSYFLAGCSLEQTGKDLTKYKVEKKVGQLQYDLVRTPKTKLTEEELEYCIFDVLVDMCYIQEEMETFGDITKIPMTKTGKVREYCKNYCFSKENKKAYSSIMKNLIINDAEEYEMLERCFQGGFTHANYHNSNLKNPMLNVYSMDFTSAYPAVMLAFQMPMSKGVKIENAKIEDIENDENHLYIFNIELHDVREKEGIPDHYLSVSKCYNMSGFSPINCAFVDNGRLIKAGRLQTTITNVDWEIIKKCYDFDESAIKVGKCYQYKKGYLPKEFCECVLKFYSDKTELKDIEGMEAEYQLKKGMLNSSFGCTVQKVINTIITFSNWHKDKNGEMTQWDECKEKENEQQIEEYNNKKSRFLFYPWGIFICAWNRFNLWSAILELGDDYIYSDTDSVKFTNLEDHKEYFEKYNEEITRKLKVASILNGFSFEQTHPMTVKGESKPLGVWDYETKDFVGGAYSRFKTLGAKRYLVEYTDKKGYHLKATIAGANKKKTSEFIAEQKDPFEFFQNNMKIDEEHSGRLIHTYIDEPFDFLIQDKDGDWYEGHERSGIYMEKSEYNLSITDAYLELTGARMEAII